MLDPEFGTNIEESEDSESEGDPESEGTKLLARIAQFRLYDQTNDDCRKLERAKKGQKFIKGEVCVKSVIPNTIVATLDAKSNRLSVDETLPSENGLLDANYIGNMF